MKPRRSTQDTLGAFSKVTLNTHRCSVRWGTLLLSFASLCLAGKSLANPFGEKLKSGSAEFVRDGNNLLIHQGSDTLIVDWKSFSIGEGELTRFFQPGSNSTALNRVYGGNPSEIYGSLRANGKVYLINPNGVFIGPSGRVDAGSFVASTLDTSDEEFLKGGSLTFKGESNSSVVNLGTITALDGDAFLIAKTVENHGSITAPNGTAGLAGGTEVILQPAGEEKIGVSIASGSGKVVNTGTIAAAQAELKAAGGNLYALAIKNTGSIRATGVERKGGRVFLRANSGTIENSGTVRARNANGSGGKVAIGSSSASPRNSGSKKQVRVANSGVVDASGSSGGTVHFKADDVSLTDSSQILASGTNGIGGDIRIEGSDVLVSGPATLIADGYLGGGAIFILAENTMEFHGIISAQAGAINASGGFAEVSGLNSLVFDGSANLSSPLGSTGTLLLDPTNFTINAASAATIVSNLATTNVVIATSSAGTAAGDIFVDSPLFYNSPNNLSLFAHRHILARDSIQNSGTGDINLIAGWDGLTALDFATTVSTPASFGNNEGSVFIGSENSFNAVAVGSRFGETNAAGFAMSVRGSDRDNVEFAQLGFHVSAGSGAVNVNGPIQVNLKNGLEVIGGDANFSYAQIGHGGTSSAGNFQGPISINIGGDLRVLGGVNFSYAQIGHGGEGSSGAQSGAITVRSQNLNLTGGTRPHANAQIGHGDGSADASGTRSGLIDVQVNGETTLMNGPGNNAIWLIGHGTSTVSGVSNADVLFSTRALDYASGSVASITTLSQDFSDKFARNLAGGNVAIHASGLGGLMVAGAFSYSSSKSLSLISDASATVNGSILNAGTGEISLVVDNANPVRPSFNPAATLTIASSSTIQSGGAIRIFAVDPAHTQLGSFVPAQRRYGTWFGDALTVSGVNFKFQPTLTLTASSLTKTYGQTITFNGTEFSVSGLQPGDALSQILTGVPILSSLGSAATAGVTGSPYAIVFDSSLATNFGYGLQLIPDSLTVMPAPLTLTADNRAKVYGSTLSFAGSEFSATGLRNRENVGLVDLGSTGAVATAGVAGGPYSITIANARGGTFNPANYAISYVPGSLTVTRAPLTITAANRSKVYGDGLVFNGTEFTSSGLLNSDTITRATLTSIGADPIGSVDSSPHAINVNNAIGSGLGNYTITYVPGALNVTPAPLTLTAVNQTKVYGNAFTFAGTEFSVIGLKNSEAVGRVDLSSPGALATAQVAGSPYAITLANARGGSFDPANYAVSYVSGTLNVTQAPLTITAANRNKVYGDSISFAGTELTASGLRNGDTVASATLTSLGAAPAANVPGSPYAINIGSAAGTGLGNYAITYVPGALSVSPAPLTLSASNQSKVYGSTFTFAGTEFSAAGLKNGENVGLVDLSSTGAIVTATVAGSPYAITIASAHGGTFNPANYSITYVPGALSVTRAPLTITASNQSKVYGTTFAFNGTEFTSTGLLNSDTISSASLSSPGAVSTAAATGSLYSINVSNATGSGLENYSITYLPGTFAVTQAGLTITATNQSKIYGGSFNFNGTEFTSVGLRNGDSISNVALSSSGAAATAGVPGSPYVIDIGNAIGTGLQNYTITYVPGTFSVAPAPLTLTAVNQSKVYGSTFNFAGSEFAATGLQNGDTVGGVDLASTGAVAVAGVTGSPYAITIANARDGTFNPANYAISYVPGALTVTQAALTITANDRSKVYGNSLTFNGTEFSSTGLLNGDTISGVNLISSGSAPTAGVAGSPYTIGVSAAIGTGLHNYTITYVPGGLTVTPAPLTLTALNQSKVYGSTLTFAGTEFSASGLQNGDSVGLVDLASNGATPAAGVAGGPYAITIANPSGGTFDPANYAISYVPGTLTVTQAPLTIAANNQSKVYGKSIVFDGTDFSATGLLNTDTITGTILTSLGTLPTAGVAASPYSIGISNAIGSGLENYSISYVPGTLTVTPAPLVLKALDQSKVYGRPVTFAGTEFSADGLQNNEDIGLVDLASIGAGPTAGVAGRPYTINVTNARGGSFDPANYAISYEAGALAVTPAPLLITALDQRKRAGNDFVFAGTEFKTSGLQNGETIALVTLLSSGALSSATVGDYAIQASSATGGTFDPANYSVSYQEGTFTVVPKPPAPPPPPPQQPPPVGPGYSLEDLLRLLTLIEQSNQTTAQNGSDLASDGPSIISGFGIQRLNLNTFFGEQLLEPGGALMIDATGLGPPLPIGEAPTDLENQLEEKPHEALEEAIAEDDRKSPAPNSTRYYDVSPGQLFRANIPGDAVFENLSNGPAVLQHATHESIEKQLILPATR